MCVVDMLYGIGTQGKNHRTRHVTHPPTVPVVEWDVEGGVAWTLPKGPWADGGTRIQTPDDDDAIPWSVLLDRPCLLQLLVFCNTTLIPSCSSVTYFAGCRRWWCTSCMSTARVGGGSCPPAHPAGVCVLWWGVPSGGRRPPPTSPVRCTRPVPRG